MHRTLLHGLAVAVMFGLAAPPGLSAAQNGNADSYVAGIPDLPLMPGLKAMPDSGVVFDKPGGRIVEAFAVTDGEARVTGPSIVNFYDATLAQLGWRREAPGAYLREGERLTLDLSEDAQGLTVHFRLFPQ